MKALQLEYPVDEHLKPIKDSDSASTSMEISTDKVRVKDLEVTGAFEVTGEFTEFLNSVPLGAYSETLIKVMASEFIANDDNVRGFVAVEDDTTDKLGIRMKNSATEAYAFIKIPNGYKATHVNVFASASTSDAVECYTYNHTDGVTTDLETFDFNSNTEITDVTASTTNDLVIKILTGDTTTVIYGAAIRIGSV